jgi:MoaA/NifB/PqqE/SkfB family radical SAM enzyme
MSAANQPALSTSDLKSQVENELNYAEFLAHVEHSRERAERGELALLPNTLWLGVSENCNLQCIGCYTEGLFRKVYLEPVDVRTFLSTSIGSFEYISLTNVGEAFLHPRLCDIIEICRELHPGSKIWVISNGTVPLKGRYRQAVSLIDRLGLSIDGATKQTFESIRRGSNFERFVENVKEIVNIRSETGRPSELGFGFTANAMNIGELAGVVRLAADLGVPKVWAQPMEMKSAEIETRLKTVHIGTLPADEVRRAIDQARQEAKRRGVLFVHARALYPPDQQLQKPEMAPESGQAQARQEITDDLAVRMCQYPWREPFQIVNEGGKYRIWACCYMVRSSAAELAKRCGLEYDRIFRRRDLQFGAVLELSP